MLDLSVFFIQNHYFSQTSPYLRPNHTEHCYVEWLRRTININGISFEI